MTATPRIIINTTPNDERAKARELVAYLHGKAERLGDERMADAAAMLDGCQAGITLFEPHAATGYVLVRCAPVRVSVAVPPRERVAS